MRRVVHFVLLFFVMGLCLSVRAQQGAPAQDKPTRLILKDGSYQPVLRYEIKGDRVRYMSAERFEWEEVPSSLIDWPATEKYAAERATAGPSAGAKEVDAEEAAERKEEEARSPEVSPGIRLPSQGGVYLLDVYNKQPQLAELVQSGGQINKDMGRNILRATINPLSSTRQTIELRGAHARVQSHVPDPFLYINIDLDQDPNNTPTALTAKDHFRIVRAEIKKDTRVVGNIKIAVYGKTSQQQKFIPTNTEVVAGSWIKVTPAEPLAPGEYALVEMLAKGEMNLYVWDFGVDPAAPPNPATWKPEPLKPNLAGTDETPVLKVPKR